MVKLAVSPSVTMQTTGALVKAKYSVLLEAESNLADVEVSIPVAVVPAQPIQFEYSRSVTLEDNTVTKRKSVRASSFISSSDQQEFRETVPLVVRDDRARCCCSIL